MVDLFIRLLLSYILLSAHSNALGEQINQDVSGSKSTVIGKNTGPITITNRYDVLKIDLEMVVLPSLHIAMGKYEVTQGQWSQVKGHNPVTSDKYDCVNDKCPVVNVGYNDILAFIEQLNQRTGNHYRLPNEEEWYAACQSKRWPGEQSSEL
ncbi:MAG: SUMF1/EgtB/PvdO family nonheme iron enzyme, partial [Methylococcaceae bacterium]